MQAMILAAGRGTRLGELGTRLPKALVDVGGQPLLARQLAYLAACGVERVVVNAHHLAAQIIDFVAHGSHPVRVEVSLEPELLGTAGGVRAALERFDDGAPIIVLHADTIVNASLEDLVAGHVAANADATIAVNWLEDTRGKGVVEVDCDGTISDFVEKPSKAQPGLANAGVYVLDRGLAELVPEHTFYDFALDLFPQALASGRYVLRAHPIDTLAHDIGTPLALALAQGRY